MFNHNFLPCAYSVRGLGLRVPNGELVQVITTQINLSSFQFEFKLNNSVFKVQAN